MNAIGNARFFLSLFIGLGLLAGCGGGGGGSRGGVTVPVVPPASPPPPPPAGFPPLAPPGPVPSGSEVSANWGVSGVNAEAGWALGHTGAGVVIGVIDDGIDPHHPELRGRVSHLSRDIIAGRNALTTTQSHGSELGSIMAGNSNGAQTVGVAYGATLLAVRSDDGSGGFAYSDLAAALNYATANGVDIVNFSLGSAQSGLSSAGGQAFRDALAAATAAGVIIVVSAGNDGDAGATNVNYPGRYASDPNVGRGLMIVAGGLDPDGTINMISNPAGTAIDHYLAAPGWAIIVPDHGPAGAVPGFQTCGSAAGIAANLCRIQGTSYASPHIAAGIALLMEAFPGMSAAELVELALESARDAGAIGPDTRYGQGIFDLEAAFDPVGTMSFATPAGFGASVVAPVGLMGAAFGDAMNNPGWSATAFDGFGRSFEMSLAPAWTPAGARDIAMESAPAIWREANDANGVTAQFVSAEPAPPQAIAHRLQETPLSSFRATTHLSANLEVTFAARIPALEDATPGATSGHLGFAGADFSVAATRRIGDARLSFVSQSGEAEMGPGYGPSDRRAMAVRVEDHVGPVRVTSSFGAVREEGAALGLVWDRAWGAAPDGMTEFAGLSLDWSPLANLSLGVSGEMGRARIEGGGWLSLAGPLTTTGAAAGARWFVTPGVLADLGVAGAATLTLSQPLRVEDGAFRALLPQSDEWGRAHLAFVEREISAAPSGREIETRLGYQVWAGEALAARAEVAHRSEPGHRADAPDALEALVGLSLRY